MNSGRVFAENMQFEGEVGIQLATHLANHYSTPDLVNLARLAHDLGIDRVWIDDNLRYRNVFVLLSAVASKVPISLGTGIMVPYFRNPVDTADALVALSELTEGRELSIGMARGSIGIVPYQVDTEPPIAFMRETVVFLKSLLSAEEIAIANFPRLARYYRFKEAARFKLAISPKSPITFYHGCSGLQAARLAGKVMDGILISGLYIALLRTGRVKGIIEAAARGRTASKTGNRFVNACEINLSMSNDRDAALQNPKGFLAHVIPGTYDALGLIEPLGIDRKKVDLMKAKLKQGTPFEELAGLISDEDVKKCYIAGTPEECREQLLDVLDKTAKLGFDRVSFKLGPDYKKTIELLGKEVVPSLTGK